jgi:putative Mn2+ efflux pump MntP
LVGVGVHGIVEARHAAQEKAALVEAMVPAHTVDGDTLLVAPGGQSHRAVHLTAIVASVDALVVGFALGAEDMRPGWALLYLAGLTFFMAIAGMSLGKRLGSSLGPRAELAASLMLTGIGVIVILGQLLDINIITAQ